MHGSIRKRLTISFIALAVGPLLLVGAILAWQSFRVLQHQALDHQQEIAKRVSGQVATFFEKIERELHVVGQVQGLLTLDSEQQNSSLSGLLSYHNVFDELILLDNQGKEQIRLARSRLNPGLGNRSHADEFIVPRTSGEAYYSPVSFDETTGEPSMTISIPLFDARTGLMGGALVSKVRLKKIWNLIAQLRIGRDHRVYIVDAKDRIVAHRNPSVVLRGTTFNVPDQAGIHSGLSKTRAVLAADKVRLGTQVLNIVSEQPLHKALAVATTMMYVISAVLVLALVMAGGLGFLIIRKIVGPIKSMATTAQAISAGDLSRQVEITTRDELGALATAFNSMTRRLIKMLGREEERTLELQREVVRRTKTEEALRESEERLDLALSVANEGIWDWYLDSNTLVFDDRYYTMAGYEPHAFPETFEEWEKRVHPDDIEPSKAAVGRYLAGKTDIYDAEFRFMRKEGHYMWIRGQGRIVARNEQGNPVRFIGTNSDITESKQANEELQQLRNYLSNIIDSMPSVLVGVDAEGRVTQWNKTAEQTTGITADKAHGKNLSHMMPQMAAEINNLNLSIQSRQVIRDQKRPRPSENGTCYEDITIYPLITNGAEGAVIRIDDVTDKVRLEEMMIQSEKMLSVGGLAAGMAHEINNPLAGIMQTAEVMANRLGNLHIPANRKAAEAAGTTLTAIESFMTSRGIPRMLDSIDVSGRRVAAIVDNMLSFARKSEATVSSHALDELLDKTLELAATDYDLKKQYDFKRIEIHREYADSLPAVPCESAKIQQVLLNLLRNGAQAMQEAGTKSPRLMVRTHFEKEREMVRMEIEDNGPGMDEETRKRVFEPFFTTKSVGVGTGLGLSVSYFIITENHDGEMAVESHPGSGAKFIIRLPTSGKKGGTNRQK
jgi:PAS domain S-box-containing protein